MVISQFIKRAFHGNLSNGALQKGLVPTSRLLTVQTRQYREISVPTPTWPDEAVKLYEQLNDLTSANWIKLQRFSDEGSKYRSFVQSYDEKMFSGALFLSPREKLSKAVIVFGPWLQGGEGHVHGGALVAVHDTALGILANVMNGPCVTANINTNFRAPILLGTTALVTAEVSELEGRKTFVKSSITCPRGDKVYSDATSLFIKLS